ncbi:N-formylglutamate amidohydrolase [Rhizobium sp. Root1220]|uniref:N-formylglutamate amidohydrolase n=1 Tax=Rhizobium sp. Root1220 TaxID=1736432 RepID=UPI000B0799FA
MATAIHEGHTVREKLADLYALAPDERLREEDPFTAFLIADITNQVIFHRSRFEIDLNRARAAAVYTGPDEAWGLNVWKAPLSSAELETSLASHDDYYEFMLSMLQGIERRHGRFILLDVHSYNHRRGGADEEPTDQKDAPDINIGTSSMNRDRWADVVDGLIQHFSGFDINGQAVDVRENVAFQGRGEQTRFIHEHFAETGCAIAVEFKKIFMDEWTGEPNLDVLTQLRAIVATAEPVLEHLLRNRR